MLRGLPLTSTSTSLSLYRHWSKIRTGLLPRALTHLLRHLNIYFSTVSYKLLLNRLTYFIIGTYNPSTSCHPSIHHEASVRIVTKCSIGCSREGRLTAFRKSDYVTSFLFCCVLLPLTTKSRPGRDITYN